MIAASDDWARDFLAQNAVVLQQQADAPTDVLSDACALPPTIFIKGEGERRQVDGGHADHAHVINMQRNMSLEAAAAFTMRSSSVAARNRLRRVARGFPEQEACLSESWCAATTKTTLSRARAGRRSVFADAGGGH